MFTLAVSAIDQSAIVIPYSWIHPKKRPENLAQSCLSSSFHVKHSNLVPMCGLTRTMMHFESRSLTHLQSDDRQFNHRGLTLNRNDVHWLMNHGWPSLPGDRNFPITLSSPPGIETRTKTRRIVPPTTSSRLIWPAQRQPGVGHDVVVPLETRADPPRFLYPQPRLRITAPRRGTWTTNYALNRVPGSPPAVLTCSTTATGTRQDRVRINRGIDPAAHSGPRQARPPRQEPHRRPGLGTTEESTRPRTVGPDKLDHRDEKPMELGPGTTTERARQRTAVSTSSTTGREPHRTGSRPNRGMDPAAHNGSRQARSPR